MYATVIEPQGRLLIVLAPDLVAVSPRPAGHNLDHSRSLAFAGSTQALRQMIKSSGINNTDRPKGMLCQNCDMARELTVNIPLIG